MVKLFDNAPASTVLDEAVETTAAVRALEGDESNLEKLDPNEPSLPAYIRERIEQKRREQQAEVQSEAKEQHRDEKKAQDTEHRERREREWLASLEYNASYQSLCADVTATQAAAHWAYEQALRQEEHTRKALEDARRNALVVSGKRVYFTDDGQHLYGEDGSEITDPGAIADARRRHAEHPDATTFEAQNAAKEAQEEAAREAEKIREQIEKLDELQKLLAKGGLSPQDLADAQQQQRDILNALPPEARARYQSGHDARSDATPQIAYRAPDPAFANAPSIDAHFQSAAAQAITIGPATPDASKSETRTPAYRAAPPF